MKKQTRYCSFCGRGEDDVSILVDGTYGCICGECAAQVNAIINDKKEEVNTYSMKGVMKPTEIKDFLDQYVIGQDLAKERIAVAVYNHYKRINNVNITDDIEIDKSNILLLGPTGTGKTMIARSIAKMLDVPFAIADATTLTESGYVGEDVESIITRLLQASDYDVEKTERGIVFIDEIDKIARKSDNPSITRDVSGEGVQQGLLKLLEGSVVNVAPNGGRKHPDQKYVQVNTKNILFICGGAFDGLEKRIAARMNQRAVGFNSVINRTEVDDETSLMKKVTVQDIRKFGLIPEILGRLPVITYTEQLNRDALIRILNEPKNAIVKQYVKLFEMDGIKLTFAKDVFEYIADKAIANKIGARGLRGIMEDIMAKAMFEMPARKVKKLHITVDYCKKQLNDTTESNEHLKIA